eukprot:scaffold120932_cov48-Phaeocystis_antarctica.AAC.1
MRNSHPGYVHIHLRTGVSSCRSRTPIKASKARQQSRRILHGDAMAVTSRSLLLLLLGGACCLRVNGRLGHASLVLKRHVVGRRQRHLDDQKRWNRRLWRWLTRAQEAVAGRPVTGPRPGCLEPPGAARRVLRRRGSRPRALPRGHFKHAAPRTRGR